MGYYQKGVPKKFDKVKINEVIADIYTYIGEALSREPQIIKPAKGPVTIIPPKFPSISEFFLKYGYTRWLYTLAKDNPELQEAMHRLQDVQSVYLTQRGLDGSYNAKVVALLGKDILGWKDKQEIDVRQRSLAEEILAARQRLRKEGFDNIIAD